MHPWMPSIRRSFGENGLSRILTIASLGLAAFTSSASSQPIMNATFCIHAYGKAYSPTSSRTIVLENQCDTAVYVTFWWDKDVSRGAACSGALERATLAPNETYRTTETYCRAHSFTASYAPSS